MTLNKKIEKPDLKIQKFIKPIISSKITILEIIFDIIIIAALRHLTNNVHFHWISSSSLEFQQSIWYILQFFFIWIIWLFFIYYINFFNPTLLKKRICFVVIFIGVAFFIYTIYSFSNPDTILTKTLLNRIIIFESSSTIYIYLVFTFIFNHCKQQHKLIDKKPMFNRLIKALVLVTILEIISLITTLLIKSPNMMIKLVLVKDLIQIIILIAAISLDIRDNESGRFIDSKHLSERYALFVSILIGESFINTLDKLLHHQILEAPGLVLLNSTGQLFFIILLLLAIWWIYVDRVNYIVSHDKQGHLHNNFYLFMNLIIIISLFLVSTGLNHILDNSFLTPSKALHENKSSLFIGLSLFAWAIAMFHAKGDYVSEWHKTLKKSHVNAFILDSSILMISFLIIDILSTKYDINDFSIYIASGLIIFWWISNLIITNYKHKIKFDIIGNHNNK